VRALSVVIAGLHEIDLFDSNPINQAVLLGDSSRPAARKFVAKRLRLTDSRKRVTQCGIYQIENAERRISISLDPVSKVL
jgi:hypothetical protein